MNEEFGSIRVVLKGSEPWFVANDVASALGYAVPKKAVIDHCKYAEIFKGTDSVPLTDSPRGISIIHESDVYRLIMRSNLPNAERFQDWVVEEVLPSIRKTGNYSMAPASAPGVRPLRDIAAIYEAARTIIILRVLCNRSRKNGRVCIGYTPLAEVKKC